MEWHWHINNTGCDLSPSHDEGHQLALGVTWLACVHFSLGETTILGDGEGVAKHNHYNF